MNRIETLRGRIADREEALLIGGQYNRTYCTGFASSAGKLLVTCCSADFFTDSRYIEAAGKGVFPGIRVHRSDNFGADVAKLLGQYGIKRVYTESAIPVKEWRSLEKQLAPAALLPDEALEEVLSGMRAIKDADEVRAIEDAQAITDAAFAELLNYIKPGLTELEVAARLEYEMKKRGSSEPAFRTIAVSGPNSSLPHGVPGDRALQPGDFLTLDFGATCRNYRSDMTRTVAVGFVTDRQREVYDTVLRAQEAAMKAARPGIRGCEMDAAARDVITAAGYGEYFGHGLGHSLGLEVHEPPRASRLFDGILEAGTVMTDEPGIYLPGEFGVRIENMVLIEGDGCRNLTASPRELIIL